MTLPPDFWYKPQPGGLVGLVVGVAAWCYFVLAVYRKTKWPSFANWFLMVLLGPLMIGGLIIGSLLALEFGH